MTDEQRNDIVNFRIENAVTALLVANCIETKSHDGVRLMLGKEFILTGKIPVELGRFYSVHSVNEAPVITKTSSPIHARP